MDQGSSLLLDIDGLVVDRVVRDGDRRAGGALLDRPASWRGGARIAVSSRQPPKAWVITRAAGCGDR